MSTLAAQWGQILTNRVLKAHGGYRSDAQRGLVSRPPDRGDPAHHARTRGTRSQGVRGRLENLRPNMVLTPEQRLHSDKQTLALGARGLASPGTILNHERSCLSARECGHHFTFDCHKPDPHGLPPARYEVSGAGEKSLVAAKFARPNPSDVVGSAGLTSRKPMCRRTRGIHRRRARSLAVASLSLVAIPITARSSRICPGGRRHWASIGFKRPDSLEPDTRFPAVDRVTKQIGHGLAAAPHR